MDQSSIDQPSIDQSNIDQPSIDQSNVDQPSIDQSNIDQPIIDQTEKKKNESVNKSGRMAILEEDKAREARRWQRKRETIKRFAGTK